MKIEVYDPPMCCSSGVCGPSVDPDLVRFAADIDWLKRQGVEVERYNLSQQPAAFARNPVVKEALTKDGNDCLPLTIVDGAVVCKSRYPTREMLAGYAGLEIIPSIFTDAVKELVALGAAIGSNCEISFEQHYNEARKLGVSKEDVSLAVEMAQSVKYRALQSTWKLAQWFLHESTTEAGPCRCGSADNEPDDKGKSGNCSCG